MNIEVLKSKIHRIKVTDANIDYIGSIEIDEKIMKSANLIEGEKVHVLSLTNGERLITYVIKGPENTNTVCVNGPAAKKIKKGHEVIVISYANVDFKKAQKFKPTIIYP